VGWGGKWGKVAGGWMVGGRPAIFSISRLLLIFRYTMKNVDSESVLSGLLSQWLGLSGSLASSRYLAIVLPYEALDFSVKLLFAHPSTRLCNLELQDFCRHT
jgi:hypothetical protein